MLVAALDSANELDCDCESAGSASDDGDMNQFGDEEDFAQT